MNYCITFSTEIPNFKEGSEIYYFVTFKLDDSKLTKEITNIDLIIFSRLNYEETTKRMKEESIREKFNVYARNILEKVGIPFENAIWMMRYVGISADNLFDSEVIDFKNEKE